mgnify:CR=1 FL=1
MNHLQPINMNSYWALYLKIKLREITFAKKLGLPPIEYSYYKASDKSDNFNNPGNYIIDNN